MTLGGLAVAVGDIVDSAIIFTEIFRRRMRGNPKADILAAALEVAPGVAFSRELWADCRWAPFTTTDGTSTRSPVLMLWPEALT